MKRTYDDFDGYFLWLCSIVNADMDRYSELLFCLHDTDFIWSLEQDESRATEGLMLREEYYHNDISEDWIMFLEKPCSVFEALIPIARRMNDLFMDENTSDMTRVWFWELIKNLGLKKYSNIRLLTGPNAETDTDFIDIQFILDRWLHREFDIDGVGSPFPVPDSGVNQREKTIIYQMYSYVNVNYVV